jgi:hypothetical protein
MNASPDEDMLSDSASQPAWALFGALALRDADLAVHSVRGTLAATALAQGMGQPVDREVFWGFLLRDVGTLEIPSELLSQPRELTAQERGVVATHALRGAELLAGIPDLSHAVSIVRHHHERWDGAGYPDGLAGKEIPFPARILSVADAFSALTAPRPHRDAYSALEAVEVVFRGGGSQFDPGIARALAALVPLLPGEVTKPITNPHARFGNRLAVHVERAASLSAAQLETLFAASLGVPAAEAASRLGRAAGTQRTWAASLRRTLAVPTRVSLGRFLVTVGRDVFCALLPRDTGRDAVFGSTAS